MIKHIKIIPLISGIIIGIIAFFFVKPEQKITYKYPTPESSENTTYKDKNGVCYKYSSTKVDCDKNESKLKSFPLSV